MKKYVIVFLIFGMLSALTGCGVVAEVEVNLDGTGQIQQMELYLSEEELEGLAEIGETEFDSAVWEKRNYREKDYYVTSVPEDERGESGEEILIKCSDKGAFLLMGDRKSESVTGVYDFYDLIIHYQRPVVDANGELLADGNSVRYDIMQVGEDSLWAAFTEDAFDETGITITGVKDGGKYKKSVRMEIASKGIMTVSRLTAKTESGTETVSVPETYFIMADGDYSYTYKVGKEENTIQFTVDMTKPKTNIANGKTYAAGKKITFSDNWSGIKSAKLDGKTIKSGKKVTAKGSHTLKLVDKCGNSKTVKFKIK